MGCEKGVTREQGSLDKGYTGRYSLPRALQMVGEDELLTVSITATFSEGQGISTQGERQVS